MESRDDEAFCRHCGGPVMSRRGFLTTSGVGVLGLQSSALDWASSFCSAAASSPALAKPVIKVVFVRPPKPIIVSWPGGQTDVDAMQALFTRTLAEASVKLDVQLEVRDAPLEHAQLDEYLSELKKNVPDGLIICAMELQWWNDVLYLAQNRGDIPTVVYSNMTAFTGNMKATRQIPKTFVGATPDVTWLAYAVRMLNAISRMKQTRLAILVGNETKDVVVDGLGTTLHMMPAARFDEELGKVEADDEVKAMAERYAKDAQEIVEPKAPDILDAAKNYIVCRRILAAENCHGLSFACLGRTNPVCMAFSRLLDEGVTAGCEADVDAALSMRLTQLLLGRSGFIQDPSPNTVSNTLVGAHCTSTTCLEGFDNPYRAPYRLRSYHTGTGACLQVLWPEGHDVTVMRLNRPKTMLLASGKVIRNIPQPPSGCCRTAVEISVDGVDDKDEAKGFHQLFILGKFERDLRAFCQLAGIEVVHI